MFRSWAILFTLASCCLIPFAGNQAPLTEGAAEPQVSESHQNIDVQGEVDGEGDIVERRTVYPPSFPAHEDHVEKQLSAVAVDGPDCSDCDCEFCRSTRHRALIAQQRIETAAATLDRIKRDSEISSEEAELLREIRNVLAEKEVGANAENSGNTDASVQRDLVEFEKSFRAYLLKEKERDFKRMLDRVKLQNEFEEFLLRVREDGDSGEEQELGNEFDSRSNFDRP